MKHYEKLYFFKNNPKIVRDYLSDFLLYQIYSVPVIRETYRRWPELHPFLRENISPEMAHLIDKSPDFLDKILQKKLNKNLIKNAIQTLKSYQI